MTLLAVYAIFTCRAGVFDEYSYRLGRNSDRVLATKLGRGRGTGRKGQMPAKGGEAEDGGGEDPMPKSGGDEDAETLI